MFLDLLSCCDVGVGLGLHLLDLYLPITLTLDCLLLKSTLSLLQLREYVLVLDLLLLDLDLCIIRFLGQIKLLLALTKHLLLLIIEPHIESGVLGFHNSVSKVGLSLGDLEAFLLHVGDELSELRSQIVFLPVLGLID